MTRDVKDASQHSMEVKLCPACHSSDFVPTGREVQGFPVRVGERDFMQEPYSVRECTSCRLLYKTRTLSATDFADYYTQIDFRRWAPPDLYPTERAVLQILRALPPGSRILDFGCSSGRLLASLGGSYQRFGHEINEAAIAEAKAKGITVLSAEELETAISSSYDAVVMIDVFEHLQQPLELLKKLGKLLKVDGWLIVVTGDGDVKLCRRDPAQFWYFLIIEHVAMMTRPHAAWLEKQLQLKLTQWKRLSHYDWTWRGGTFLQMAKYWAYWRFRTGNQFTKGMLRRLPGFQKAEHWPTAPGFQYSADHAVAVFRKVS